MNTPELAPIHKAALEAAFKGPIFSAALGQHADPACREYNFSVIQFLKKNGLVWEHVAIDQRAKYYLTSRGLDLIIQLRFPGG